MDPMTATKERPPETWSDERAFVGRLLTETTEEIGKALEQVDSGCIEDTTLRQVYSRMRDSFKEHGKIRHLDLVGEGVTFDYLSGLIEVDRAGIFTPSADLMPRILKAGMKRKVVELVIAAGQKALEDPAGALALLDAGMADISYRPNVVDNAPLAVFARILEKIKSNIERKAKYVGVETAWRQLSDVTSGFQPGHLWIVGAYTSQGKTAFAIEQIVSLLLAGRHVIVFSTEMSVEQIMLRLIARHSGCSTNRILLGYANESELTRATDLVKLAADVGLRVYDDVYKVEQMRLIAKRDKAVYGELDLVVIDFVQNISGEGSAYERVSAIAIEIQKLARQVGSTVLALSQISNESHKNGDDGFLGYKNAGELAAAADIGIMLRRDKDDAQKLMVSIQKNRHGKCGKFMLRFNAAYTALLPHQEEI